MDIVESLIIRPGQSREERLAEELGPHFADVEERRADGLYELVRKLAANMRYYGVDAAGNLDEQGDWQPFFTASLPATRGGDAAPHLALLAAFLKLYRIPRCAMNGLTARHMDFFYRRVLGFTPAPARPDRAHIVLELKKAAQPVEVGPGHIFSAGKDKAGTEMVYAPAAATIVNGARVEHLHSIFRDPASGRLYCAPKADSSDGLGGALDRHEPKWPPFGPHVHEAPVGFAVSSPVLRLNEGRRAITLELMLGGAEALEGFIGLPELFECVVSGETRWLGPYAPTGSIAGGTMSLSFTVPEADEAVVDYDAGIHGQAFAARAPVVQVLLKRHGEKEAPFAYAALAPVTVSGASVTVDVQGIKGLQLESDAGPLDPRRAFQPFGSGPIVGSRLQIGCPEALRKKLRKLRLKLTWLGAPASDHRAAVVFQDAGGWEESEDRELFDFNGEESGEVNWTFTAPGVEPPVRPLTVRDRVLSYAGTGTSVGREVMLGLARADRKFPAKLAAEIGGNRVAVAWEMFLRPPKLRPGFITITLHKSFGHATFRLKALKGKLEDGDGEPYTPTLRELALGYTASVADAALATGNADEFAGAELQFFHVDCFGERREHGFLRAETPHAASRGVPLLPEHADAGELVIGLSGVRGGDSVSLLFQVAAGSADPAAAAQPVTWAVLASNYWKPLAGDDAVRDGTNGLLASGLVVASLPPQASIENTLLPTGLLWLKAAVPAQVGAVCSLVAVVANGVELVRRAGDPVLERVWLPLEKGRITRMKTPLAPVKAVSQPFASFGGSAAEGAMALRTRAAERLRHRNRCVSAWDYERAVLEAFPQVRKVKCIPHSRPGGPWLNPGEVLLVVVPDLRNRNAIDPLQPRTDADTLRRIETYARARAGGQVVIQARNPRYQRVRLDFRVRFRRQLEFNYHARRLREALIAYLSPWTQDPGQAIAFGGAIHKSVLLDFVEDLDYVDYVAHFRMHDLRGGGQDLADVAEARAAAPDAILVSDASHDIAEAQ